MLILRRYHLPLSSCFLFSAKTWYSVITESLPLYETYFNNSRKRVKIFLTFLKKIKCVRWIGNEILLLFSSVFASKLWWDYDPSLSRDFFFVFVTQTRTIGSPLLRKMKDICTKFYWFKFFLYYNRYDLFVFVIYVRFYCEYWRFFYIEHFKHPWNIGNVLDSFKNVSTLDYISGMKYNMGKTCFIRHISFKSAH